MRDVDLGVKEWEDSILYPLKVMRWVLLIYLLFIAVVPIYKNGGLFIDSWFTGICGVILILGYLNRCGRVGDLKPMLLIIICRGINLFSVVFILKNCSLNFLVWVLIVLFEIGLSFFYLLDSSRYECVKELEEK